MELLHTDSHVQRHAETSSTLCHPRIPLVSRRIECRKEKTYAERLQTMVGLWRKEWGQGELPFYLVEIAPYDYGEGISGALFREAQFRQPLSSPTAV